MTAEERSEEKPAGTKSDSSQYNLMVPVSMDLTVANIPVDYSKTDTYMYELVFKTITYTVISFSKKSVYVFTFVLIHDQ